MICDVCKKPMKITQKHSFMTEYFCEDCNSYIVTSD